MARRSGFGKRVDDADTGIAESSLVPAHHREIVDQRGRGEESVENGNRLAQSEASPLVSHPLIDWQDVVGELGPQAV